MGRRNGGSFGQKHQTKKSYVLFATVALALSSYLEKVSSLPVEINSENNWPTFPRRNIASMARAGYLRNAYNAYKRSISTLAKNGQLPTFRAPFDGVIQQTQDDEDSHEKRNLASIARMRSYYTAKRNVQALARDGYPVGRRQMDQSNEKRNLASIARSGLIHKKNQELEDEFYLPFYQNSIPPLSELDGPLDMNELYDYQQSVNPDMFPPMSQVFKRSSPNYPSREIVNQYVQYDDPTDMENDWMLKRGISGMPVHGLMRQTFVDPSVRSKRYILSLPDVIYSNNVDVPQNDDAQENDKRSVDNETENDERDNFEKRHIGSLARLGLLPSFRFSGGRYLRSGRARLLAPSQELYRKHSSNENFGIRQYIPGSEAEPAADPDDANISPASVSANSHPTGRILHRPLNHDLVTFTASPVPSPLLLLHNYYNYDDKTRWQSAAKEIPKSYYFRSLKVPGKRYLLMPAIDKILLKNNKYYSSLPSRRKNQ